MDAARRVLRGGRGSGDRAPLLLLEDGPAPGALAVFRHLVRDLARSSPEGEVVVLGLTHRGPGVAEAAGSATKGRDRGARVVLVDASSRAPGPAAPGRWGDEGACGGAGEGSRERGGRRANRSPSVPPASAPEVALCRETSSEEAAARWLEACTAGGRPVALAAVDDGAELLGAPGGSRALAAALGRLRASAGVSAALVRVSTLGLPGQDLARLRAVASGTLAVLPAERAEGASSRADGVLVMRAPRRTGRVGVARSGFLVRGDGSVEEVAGWTEAEAAGVASGPSATGAAREPPRARAAADGGALAEGAAAAGHSVAPRARPARPGGLVTASDRGTSGPRPWSPAARAGSLDAADPIASLSLRQGRGSGSPDRERDGAGAPAEPAPSVRAGVEGVVPPAVRAGGMDLSLRADEVAARAGLVMAYERAAQEGLTGVGDDATAYLPESAGGRGGQGHVLYYRDSEGEYDSDEDPDDELDI